MIIKNAGGNFSRRSVIFKLKLDVRFFRFCGGINFLYQSLQHISGANLNKFGCPVLYHILNALRPFNRSGKLEDEVFLYFLGLGNGKGRYVLVDGAGGF